MKHLTLILITFFALVETLSAQVSDTLDVYNYRCVSNDPRAIDTTIFSFHNDTLLITNINNNFCAPRKLIAIVKKSNDTTMINVKDTSSTFLLCSCSFAYTVKIPNQTADTFKITINGEFFKVSKSKLISNIISSSQHDLKVYPNPVDQFLHIDNLLESDNVVIADLYGRDLLKVNNNDNVVDLGFLRSGIYVIIIKSKNYISYKKIFKK